jgi:hypothetical protein
MRLLRVLVALAPLSAVDLIATATPPSFGITWKWPNGTHGDGAEEIYLYSHRNASSVTVVVEREGRPKKVKPGWVADPRAASTIYRSLNQPQKFREVVAAGIKQLKPFQMQNARDSVIIVRFEAKEIEIPEFYGEGPEDHCIGSENHKRFLAVKKIMDEFDTEPCETPE